MLRMHPFVRKSTTATDIIDPLPLELKMYHQETSFRSSVEPSKASYGLKKYVIEQEKK